LFKNLISFIGFLKQAGLCDQVETHLPWRLTSPNAIAPEYTLTAFIIGVVIGARRFAHTELAKADRALHAMLGLKRRPGADTVRSFFHRFTSHHPLLAVLSGASFVLHGWLRSGNTGSARGLLIF